MRKLILLTPILLLAAAAPGLAQGVQMPNAPNAEAPPSLDTPPRTSLSSGNRASRARQTPRRPRQVQRRPAPAQ